MKKYTLFLLLIAYSGFYPCKSEGKDNKRVIDLRELVKNVSNHDTDTVYYYTDATIKPEFPGGMQALNKFIISNMIYPEQAVKDSIFGRVVVKFVIEKNGLVRNTEVIKGVDSLLDIEAINVINKLPQWKPGYDIFNEPIRVSYIVPVAFRNLKNKDVRLKHLNKLNYSKTTANGESQVINVVEKMPEFPGGQKQLIQYLSKNVKYPDKARKQSISGRVYVSYIVEKNGSISNINIEKGVDPLLDQEAIRVVQNMPKWEPGNNGGKPIRVKYTLPINFLLKHTNSEKESIESYREKKDEVLLIVEKMPMFPGGTNAMNNYVTNHLIYPLNAQKRGIEGKVFVNFVVEKDGSLSNAIIIRGVHPLLDKQALRVVNSMPKWIQGRQKGRLVRVSFTMPIAFELD